MQCRDWVNKVDISISSWCPLCGALMFTRGVENHELVQFCNDKEDCGAMVVTPAFWENYVK